MGFITDLAEQTVGQVIGTGMGMATAGWQDKRQRKQQEKLTRIQLEAQKEMGEFNYQKQMDLWNATNYGAQMEHLKKAGLNPALMYGMGGGGGQTAAAQSGSVGGASAAGGSGEVMQGMGMQMQAAMTQAHIKVMESQAKLNEVEADKKAGVDTEEAQTRIKSLLTGVESEKAKQALMAVETTLKRLETVFTGATMEDNIDRVSYETGRAFTELERAQNETYISKATRQEQIKIVQNEAIAGVLRNILTDQQTTESKARINKMAEEIMQKWTEITQNGTRISQETTRLGIETFKAKLMEQETEFKVTHPTPMQQAGGAMKKGGERIENIGKETWEAIENTLEKIFNRR